MASSLWSSWLVFVTCFHAPEGAGMAVPERTTLLTSEHGYVAAFRLTS
jgi:hypothetical protein